MLEGPHILLSNLKSTVSQEIKFAGFYFEGLHTICLSILGVCEHSDATVVPFLFFLFLLLLSYSSFCNSWDIVLGLSLARQSGPLLSGVALASCLLRAAKEEAALGAVPERA